MLKNSIGQLWISCFVLAIVATFTCLAVQANYYLPEPKARFMVIANDWNINLNDWNILSNGKPRQLNVTKGAKKYTWTINSLWLADRVNSDSICTGNYHETTRAYLEKLQSGNPKGPLLVELIDTDGKAKLFVAGLWKFDSRKGFENGSLIGSRFGWSAEEVQSFKTPEVYEKKAQAISDKNWPAVESLENSAK